MEHDLLIVETGVDGLGPRLAVSDIQAAPESGGEMEKSSAKDGQKQSRGKNKVERSNGRRDSTQPQGRTKRH